VAFFSGKRAFFHSLSAVEEKEGGALRRFSPIRSIFLSYAAAASSVLFSATTEKNSLPISSCGRPGQ